MPYCLMQWLNCASYC